MSKMSVLYLYFTLFIFIVPNILCDKVVRCELDDEECVTAAYKVLFKKAVAGNPAYKIMSSDPLYQDKIEIFLPHMNVTFNEAHMQGIKSCDPQHLRMLNKDWLITFICPRMILQSDYDINGEVDSIHIEGKGRCEIIYENYEFTMHGGYETYVGESGKEYLNVTYYEVESRDVQGNVVYNFTNLFNGDNEQSVKVHEYINTNWKKLDSIIGKQILYSLFGYYVNNIRKYLVIIPILDIFNKPK